MNTEIFTGRAHAYAEARPGYPEEVMEYIIEFASPDAVFADIGAGTGKFSLLIAKHGLVLFTP